jgi:hypothetical protein
MFINNLASLLKTEIVEENYYICGLDKAKELVLEGFSPVGVDEQQNYFFYKSNVLMDFLRKGEVK